MVYYVRFLKSPRIQKHKADSISVSALICLTTDLGDSFLADDVDLAVTLVVDRTNTVLQQRTIRWQAGKRELGVSLGPFRPPPSNQAVVLGIGAAGESTSRSSGPHRQADNLLDRGGVPPVISGWSTPFGGSQPALAEKLVERRFSLQDQPDLRVWEETGNSIARHIW